MDSFGHRTHLRNCHGKFFCSFLHFLENFPETISQGEKCSHTKSCFPLGKAKSLLPTGKMASVVTPDVYRVFFRHQRSEICPFDTQNYPAKVWYIWFVYYEYFLFRCRASFKIISCNNITPFSFH